MKKTLLLFAIFTLSIGCKDDETPEIPDFPIRLAFAETGSTEVAMLRTFGTNDIPADMTLPITQMTQDLFNDNVMSIPDSIVLVSDNLSYFDAADAGFLTMQTALDSIPYTLSDDNFEFNVVSSDRVISGTGTPIEITIPYRTFVKRGISSSGGTHLPVSYENFLFTDFFEGDSIVYIQYDVIYRYMP